MHVDNSVVKNMFCLISVVKLRRVDHRWWGAHLEKPVVKQCRLRCQKWPFPLSKWRRLDHRSSQPRDFPLVQKMTVSVVTLHRFDHRSCPTKGFARGFENEEQRAGSSLNLTSALPLAWPCPSHVSHGVGNDRKWKATSEGPMRYIGRGRQCVLLERCKFDMDQDIIHPCL